MRDIVIPVKGGGGEPLFTIVCEVLPVPGPPALQEPPALSRLWKVQEREGERKKGRKTFFFVVQMIWKKKNVDRQRER